MLDVNTRYLVWIKVIPDGVLLEVGLSVAGVHGQLPFQALPSVPFKCCRHCHSSVAFGAHPSHQWPYKPHRGSVLPFVAVYMPVIISLLPVERNI